MLLGSTATRHPLQRRGGGRGLDKFNGSYIF